MTSLIRGLPATLLSIALLATAPAAGWAHRAPNPSDASAVSLLPVAVSVAGATALPVLAASGTALFTVLAVQTVASGTVLLLGAASTGAQLSVELAAGVSVAVGSGVVAVATATGWVLSTAADAGSQALCFIPNAVGASLLYNERVTR